jgi:hypothetical protein
MRRNGQTVELRDGKQDPRWECRARNWPASSKRPRIPTCRPSRSDRRPLSPGRALYGESYRASSTQDVLEKKSLEKDALAPWPGVFELLGAPPHSLLCRRYASIPSHHVLAKLPHPKGVSVKRGRKALAGTDVPSTVLHSSANRCTCSRVSGDMAVAADDGDSGSGSNMKPRPAERFRGRP